MATAARPICAKKHRLAMYQKAVTMFYLLMDVAGVTDVTDTTGGTLQHMASHFFLGLIKVNRSELKPLIWRCLKLINLYQYI